MKLKEHANPLVSIIIITYNSANFVLETLESAKSQTYNKIELIVSDDSSTDGTVEICRQWINENKACFVDSEIIISNTNTGIPANCNRGVRIANGEWIKIIAGDDILHNDCISNNVHFINENKEANFVFSKMQRFIFSDRLIPGAIYPKEEAENFFFEGTKSQYHNILQDNFVANTPTSFIRSTTLKKLGCFDEKYPLFEDFPLWLKALQNGYRLFYFSDVTVRYRMGESVSNTKSVWVNKKYFESRRTHFGDHIAKDLSKINYPKYIERYLYFKRTSILTKLFNNKKNFLSVGFNYFAIKVCNIIVYLSKFKSVKV